MAVCEYLIMQIDIEAISTTNCICGAKKLCTDSNAIYGNGYEDLHCNDCDGTILGEIYHCPPDDDEKQLPKSIQSMNLDMISVWIV